ncbi:MAG: hypothetical protein ACJ77E_18640 [Gaiellaceae bacterium]
MIAAFAALPAAASAEGDLRVFINGSGGGRVVSDSRALVPIDCPSACDSLTGLSRVLTLTALPNPESSVAAWTVDPSAAIVSGCGHGTTCTVFVVSAVDSFEGGAFIPHTAVTTVTVLFVRNPDPGPGTGVLRVATNGNGAGRVAGDSPALAPIDCPSACGSVSGANRVLTLTALPSGDSSVGGWSVDPTTAIVGGCGSATTCTVSVGTGTGSFEEGVFVPRPAVVSVTATFVRNPDSAFLCYSRFQIEPGVWPAPEAETLFASGYWQPYAILGTRSATRLGPYSLVCNLPSTATVFEREAVDDGGALIVGTARAPLGLYPVAR